MPDMLKHENGDTDWSKIFMGFALALVYIMQSYHAMQVADLKSQVVPRAEYELKHSQVMDKDEILKALEMISKRMDNYENK